MLLQDTFFNADFHGSGMTHDKGKMCTVKSPVNSEECTLQDSEGSVPKTWSQGSVQVPIKHKGYVEPLWGHRKEQSIRGAGNTLPDSHPGPTRQPPGPADGQVCTAPARFS